MAQEYKWDAWVAIKWKAGAPYNAYENFDFSNIKGCWSTTGHYDCQLWVDIHSPDELEKFVWNTIRKNEWVDYTETFWAKEFAYEYAK